MYVHLSDHQQPAEADPPTTSTQKTDGSDDLSQESAVIIPTEADKIVSEHGPLILSRGSNTTLNLPAVAAAFAANYQVATFTGKGLYRYDQSEGIWQPLAFHEMMPLIFQFIKKLADDHEASSLLSQRSPGIAATLNKMIPHAEPAQNSSLRLLAVANGVLDLSGEVPLLKPHRADNYFTNKLLVKYEPDSLCPRFLDELVRPALPQPDDVDLLQRDLGRQLFPGNSAQTLSILTGTGGSGKSVLISILERMIGEHQVAQLRSDKLNGRFETHAFHGKSTLVGKDVSPDYLSKEGAGMIKALTGSDRLDTEVKYGGKLAINGNFYVVITSNARLKLRPQDDESAWERRLICYSFSRQMPSKRVNNFDELLIHEEGSGILNWLIEGYLKHRQELKQHGRFVLTEAQKQRVVDLLDESKGPYNYLKNELTPSDGTVTSDELWLQYVKYAVDRKWGLLLEQQFKTALPTLMLQLFGLSRRNDIVRRGSMVRGFKGVMFKKDLKSILKAKLPKNDPETFGCEARDDTTRSLELMGGTSNQ